MTKQSASVLLPTVDTRGSNPKLRHGRAGGHPRQVAASWRIQAAIIWLATVQHWEQGRALDQAANNCLRVIMTDPLVASRAQEQPVE